MPSNSQTLVRSRIFQYAPGPAELEHSHDEHQLVYARLGLLVVETRSSRWLVPSQRALWVPAGTNHSIVARSHSEMAALYFDSTVALHEQEDVTVISVTPLLKELINSVGSVSDEDRRLHLEAVILDELSDASVATPLRLSQLEDPRVRAIAEALDADPADRRTLAEFGGAVGASERTLQRLFASETGSTFGRWRTQLRLQHGMVALSEGHTVASAALRCGYQEPSAFIVAFRSAFGTTPGRHRAG